MYDKDRILFIGKENNILSLSPASVAHFSLSSSSSERSDVSEAYAEWTERRERREDKERTRDWQIIRGYRWASCLPHTLLFTPISSRRFLTAFGHLLISYGVNRKCNEPWVTEERRRRERTMNDGENKIQIRR